MTTLPRRWSMRSASGEAAMSVSPPTASTVLPRTATWVACGWAGFMVRMVRAAKMRTRSLVSWFMGMFPSGGLDVCRTRQAVDDGRDQQVQRQADEAQVDAAEVRLLQVQHDGQRLPADDAQGNGQGPDAPAKQDRSEEHTSELQSPDHLVCRLL